MRRAVIAVALIGLAAHVASADRIAIPERQERRPPRKPLAPPRPRVAPEIEAAGKAAAGTWTCTGGARTDDGRWVKMSMSFTTALDLDNAWVKTSVLDTIDGKPPIKLMQYLTFDPVSQEWTKIELDSTGARSVETATRPDDGVWVWRGVRTNGDGTQNTSLVRSHDQSDQVTSSAWAEQLIDGTWTKVNESSCKRTTR